MTLPSDTTDTAKLIELVRDVQASLKEVSHSPIDEDRLKEDIGVLKELLEGASSELTATHDEFQQINTKARTQDGKSLLLVTWETNPDQLEEVKHLFAAARRLTHDLEDVVEALYKITSSRAVLAKLKDSAVQRFVGQTLAKISVSQERLFETRRSLKEAIDELERRGIDENLSIAGNPISPDAVAPTPKEKAPRSGLMSSLSRVIKKPSAELRETLATELGLPVRTEAEAPGKRKLIIKAPEPTPPPRESEPEPVVSAGTPPAESAQEASFSGLQLTSQDDDASKRTEVSAGDRVGDDGGEHAARDHDGGDESSTTPSSSAPGPRSVASQWASATKAPPAEAKTETETKSETETETETEVNKDKAEPECEPSPPVVTVNSSEPVVEPASLRSALEAWVRRSPLAPAALAKSSRVLAVKRDHATMLRAEATWSSAETSGASTKSGSKTLQLEEVVGGETIPGKLFAGASGSTVHRREATAGDASATPTGLRRLCRDALESWNDADNTKRRLLERCQTAGPATNDVGGQYDFARWKVEVLRIPILLVECEHRPLRREPVRFDAWLIGEDERLHLANPPRSWSPRAWGILAGCALASVPIGYGLARLLEGI